MGLAIVFISVKRLMQCITLDTTNTVTYTPACMDKSTLIDAVLTNFLHKYSAAGVFCNDVSDHCMVACVRKCKTIKTMPWFIFIRNLKRFNEQAFLHEIYKSDLNLVCFMDDVELARDYFKETFVGIIDKYAPIRRQSEGERQTLV